VPSDSYLRTFKEQGDFCEVEVTEIRENGNVVAVDSEGKQFTTRPDGNLLMKEDLTAPYVEVRICGLPKCELTVNGKAVPSDSYLTNHNNREGDDFGEVKIWAIEKNGDVILEDSNINPETGRGNQILDSLGNPLKKEDLRALCTSTTYEVLTQRGGGEVFEVDEKDLRTVDPTAEARRQKELKDAFKFEDPLSDEI